MNRNPAAIHADSNPIETARPENRFLDGPLQAVIRLSVGAKVPPLGVARGEHPGVLSGAVRVDPKPLGPLEKALIIPGKTCRAPQRRLGYTRLLQN